MPRLIDCEEATLISHLVSIVLVSQWLSGVGLVIAVQLPCLLVAWIRQLAKLKKASHEENDKVEMTNFSLIILSYLTVYFILPLDRHFQPTSTPPAGCFSVCMEDLQVILH